MTRTAEVTTMFSRRDKVRVRHDLSYFDQSVLGVEMTVLDIQRFKGEDGKEVVHVYTDKMDPVSGLPYNEFELVKVMPWQ